MGIFRTVKKTIIIYFPRLYRKFCEDQPVQENKILFLEMRFDHLSNSMQHMYDVMEKSGKYNLACAHLYFNFSRGREFTENVQNMLKELATAKCVILDEASIVLSCLPLRPETMAINLWHGCGAFKKFGRSTAELKFGASAATLDKYPNYGNLDLVTVSSPEVIWAYEEAMNLPKGIVQESAVPTFFMMRNLWEAAGKNSTKSCRKPEAKKLFCTPLPSAAMLLLPSLRTKLISIVLPRNWARTTFWSVNIIRS